MGLHAWAIYTGSGGLDPTYISSSNATVADGPPAKWYTYRILAKARDGEQQNIGLVFANPETIYDVGAGAYWEDVTTDPTIGILSGISSQKGFYMPRYRNVARSGGTYGDGTSTISTSSWQWVQGLDNAIKTYNGLNAGNEYYPGNYGWILGVCKNGTTNGWNVESWFWGSPGIGGGIDPQGAQSFVEVVNSLPIGAFQPTSANNRTFTDAQTAFNAICYSVVDKYNGYSSTGTNASSSGNFVVVYNTGSTLLNVGVEYSINVMDTSIW
jgi:hypothetical protein